MLAHDLAIVDRADVAVASCRRHARAELRQREGDDGADKDERDEHADDLDRFLLERNHDIVFSLSLSLGVFG